MNCQLSLERFTRSEIQRVVRMLGKSNSRTGTCNAQAAAQSAVEHFKDALTITPEEFKVFRN